MSENPVLSINTKKEFIGDFSRERQVYTTAAQVVYDHDIAMWATGVVSPHGVYDKKRNQAYLT